MLGMSALCSVAGSPVAERSQEPSNAEVSAILEGNMYLCSLNRAAWLSMPWRQGDDSEVGRSGAISTQGKQWHSCGCICCGVGGGGSRTIRRIQLSWCKGADVGQYLMYVCLWLSPQARWGLWQQ